MRKTLTALSIALALASGQAMADQAIASAVSAIQGISLTSAQIDAITNATDDTLKAAIQDAVSKNKALATQIVAAAIAAATSHEELVAIIEGAMAADPSQAQAIAAAANEAGTALGLQVSIAIDGKTVTIQSNLGTTTTTTSGGAGGDTTSTLSTYTFTLPSTTGSGDTSPN